MKVEAGRPIDLSRQPAGPACLVEGVLEAGLPGFVGGPDRWLNTAVGLDLAVSVAAGAAFLGEYATPGPRRVAVFSAGPGGDHLAALARRIAWERGVEVPAADALRLVAGSPRQESLAGLLAGWGTEVAVLDAAGLLLDAGHRPPAVARRYRELADACLSGGATPVFLHHAMEEAKRRGELPDAADPAYAGATAVAGQWLLVNRRARYDPERQGRHRLWLVAGGPAAGFAAGVTASEGTDRGRWDVRVQGPEDARWDDAQADAAQAADRLSAKMRAATEVAVTRLQGELPRVGQSVPKAALSERTGLNGRLMNGALDELEANGVVELGKQKSRDFVTRVR